MAAAEEQSKGRDRWENDARRKQLLELGMELFSERPFADVWISDIAKRAGVSKGLLYHYFGNKRDFYVEVVREGCRQLLETVEADPDLPPDERARAGLTAYLDFVSEREKAYVTLVRSGVGVDERIVEILEETRQANAERMLEGVGLKVLSPVFRTMARAWVGTVEAAALDWIEHKDIEKEVLVEALLGAVAGIITSALAADPNAEITLELD